MSTWKRFLPRVVDYLEATATFSLKPAAAISYFQAKGLRTTWAWTDMLGEEHNKAFTVAKLMDKALLSDVKAAVETYLVEGRSLREFQELLTPLLQARGWWGKVDGAQLGSAWRLETIYRTNLATSYAAGTWDAIQAQKDLAPWLMYSAIDDARTRPTHRAMDRTILPVTDPWWSTHYPPNGFNCRCSVIQLSDGELKALGLKRTPPPKAKLIEWRPSPDAKPIRQPADIDPGWAYNAGKNGMAPLKRELKAAPKPSKAPPPPPVPAPEPTPKFPWNPNTTAGRWHEAAMKGAPDWMIAAIGKTKPATVAEEINNGAYCSPQYINMSFYSPGTPKGNAVWRHEYGHWMDSKFSPVPGAPTAYLGHSDGATFRAAMATDRTAVNKAKAVLVSAEGSYWRTGKAPPVNLHSFTNAYIEKGQESYFNGKFNAWLKRRLKAIGITETDQAKKTLEDLSVHLWQADGLQYTSRMTRALWALENGEAEFFLYSLAGEFPDMRWKAFVNSEELGQLSDLLGSLTRNEKGGMTAGSGHPTEYYYKDDRLPGTEIFANLTALLGRNNETINVILERLFPAVTKAYIERLKL